MKGNVDFQEIKERIKLLEVFDKYGITPTLRETPKALVGKCPLHKGSKHGQFNVQPKKGVGGVWFCFGNCDAGGGVLEFVQRYEKLATLRDAGLKLLELFSDRFSHVSPSEAAEPTNDPRPKKQEKPSPQTAQNKELPSPAETSTSEGVLKPLGFPLQNLDPTHASLKQRGLTESTIETFELGYYSGKGMLKNRIAIPVHDPEGKFIVGYIGRAVDAETEPRYLIPPNFPKGHVVYNLHRAVASVKENPALPLIITEGFFDVFHLHQCGYPNAIALMGSALIEEGAQHQKDLLLQSWDKYIILMDADEKGRTASQKIANQLILSVLVRIVFLPNLSPEKFQPEHFSQSELSNLLRF